MICGSSTSSSGGDGTGAGGGIGDLCLMPPSVKREVHFLVLSVFGAEGMPRMDDKAAFGLVKAGIDAFVEVKVRGWAWLVGGTVRQGDACAGLCNRSNTSLDPVNHELVKV